MKDHYEVLGVRRSAAEAEIALAYKGRRTQYHPDKYQGSDAQTLQWATARMQEVNEAYAVLSDAQRRARFDALSPQSSDDVAADEPAANRRDAPAPATASLQNFLRQRFASDRRFSRTYFAPDIPLKKLSNALQSYGRGIQAEEVVALMDTTVFGGAKDGVMLTENQIRLKDLGSGLGIWRWPDIRSIEAEKTGIYINGHKLIDCLAVNEGEVAHLVSGLQAFLQLRSQARPGPQSGQHRGTSQEDADSLSQYRSMYDMAKREFLDLCEKIQKFEFQLGENFIDRENAAAYFGYLEQCLQDAGRAERAWAILGEIAILSKAIVDFSDTGKAVPPVIARQRGDDSQLVMELRALLRFLQEAVQEAERQANARQFFRR
ncbi:hypothetical protein CY658_31905 [Variovorax sp. RO1]|uniref:J domain-containing protein n=1 Tax=Variovorax sp. RO1 TaxID=2066034 RepID=UPI000C7163DF|nr:J domain-containing protein [Variovorax sp. RO1]PLC01529.1 hypothetical protein CY658_31905 [Variovorax sp. RO1]